MPDTLAAAAGVDAVTLYIGDQITIARVRHERAIEDLAATGANVVQARDRYRRVAAAAMVRVEAKNAEQRQAAVDLATADEKTALEDALHHEAVARSAVDGALASLHAIQGFRR